MLEDFHVDAVISLPAGAPGRDNRQAWHFFLVSRREPAEEVVFVGDQLWTEGWSLIPKKESQRILLDAIPHRQGLVPRSKSNTARPISDRAGEHMIVTITHALSFERLRQFDPDQLLCHAIRELQ